MAGGQSVAIASRERAALRLSLLLGLLLSGSAVFCGLIIDSQAVLFDGIYSLLGVAVTWLALRASVLVARGPDQSYPYGRDALSPLVVGIQGFVLLGVFIYAAVAAVSTILSGGSGTEVGGALAYSCFALVVSIGARVALPRFRARSDLVAAETASWHVAVTLGLAWVCAFGAAFALQRTAYAPLVPYVDPALVLLSGLLVLPTPFRLIKAAYRELLEASAESDITTPIELIIDRLTLDEGLPTPETRITKLGNKIYVEIDWLLTSTGCWDLADADRLRRLLNAEFRAADISVWLNVELHTDPHWDT